MFKCPHMYCSYSSSDGFSLRCHVARCQFKDHAATTPGLGQDSPIAESSATPSATRTSECSAAPGPDDIGVALSPSPSPSDGIPNRDASSVEGSRPSEEDIIRFMGSVHDKIGDSAMNRFFSLMRNEWETVQQVLDSTSSARVLADKYERIRHDDLLDYGFDKKTVSSACRSWSGTLYCRDPVTVLQQQIAGWGDREQCVQTPLYNIQTDKMLEIIDFLTTRATVHSQQSFQMEMSTDKDCPTFLAGMVQLFSDKTHTSLSSTAFVGYPLHIVLLNYPPAYIEHCIRSGKTCVGFLPVQLERSERGWETSGHSRFSKSAENTARKTLLHEAFETVLRPLSAFVYSGFNCARHGGYHLLCFPVITSICCDIPEAKEVCALKNSSQTRFPCHRCLWKKGVQPPWTPRSLALTKMLRCSTSAGVEQYASEDVLFNKVKAEYADGSVQTWASYLETCPLVLPDYIHGMYACFGFELLHNLHLGLSRMLKLAFLEYASSCARPARTTRGISNRTLFARICNDYVAEVDEWYPYSGMKFDLSPHAHDGREDGFMTPKGLKGMMEGKFMRNLDVLFPFLCTLLDSVFADGTHCPFTSIQVAYNDVLTVALERPDGIVTQTEAEERGRRLENVTKLFVDLVEQYLHTRDGGLHASLKYHLLHHASSDVHAFGSLAPLCASTYEYSNTLFKKMYRTSSKRRKTAMQETVVRFAGHVHDSAGIVRAQKDQRASQDVPRFPLACDSVAWSTVTSGSNEFRQNVPISIGHGDAFNVLVGRMFEAGVVETMEMVQSAKIAGYGPPSAQDMCDHGEVPGLCVQVKVSDPRYVTDIYATAQYGPTQSRRYSTIGYKVHEESGNAYVKYGKCALLFRLKDKHGHVLGMYIAVETLPIVKPMSPAQERAKCIMVRCVPEWMENDMHRRAEVAVIPLRDVCMDVYVAPAFIRSSSGAQLSAQSDYYLYVNKYRNMITSMRGKRYHA